MSGPSRRFRLAWAVLGPSRWLLLGVVVLLSWRLAGWWLREAFTMIQWQPREGGKGIAWDLFLGYGLFASYRAICLLRADDVLRSVARWRLLAALPVAVAVVSGVLRAADAAHCYLAQSHWTPQAFMYIDQGFAGSLWSGRMALSVTVAVLAIGALVLALVRDGAMVARRAVSGRWSGRTRLALAAVAVGVSALPAFWALKDGIKYPPHVHHWRLIPEVNFVVQWAQTWRDDSGTVADVDLHVSEAHWKQFVSVGIVPSNSAPDAPFPLLRSDLDEPPLKVPRRPGVAADARPNVVITFMESVNRLFVHALSGHYRGLMPNLSALAGEMTRVDGFRNTSAPTIVAMVAALCSVHPPAHPYDLAVGESVDGRTAYMCLADVLRRYGYRTVFVQGSSCKVTSMGYFFRTHGFDEVICRDAITADWPGRELGFWGLYDRDLLVYAERQVHRLERLRDDDGRPYLLVVVTLDPHEPGMGPADALDTFRGHLAHPGIEEVPDDAAAHKLLASYHSSDQALGRWGRFLLSAARKRTTMSLLTTDHAAFRNLVTNTIFHDKTDNRSFDHVPFLLHDPLHALPARVEVLSGTTDLAPTLLHLLGMTNGLTSMTGKSIFGQRPSERVLVGRIGLRYAYLHGGSDDIDIPIGVVRERCQNGEKLLADGSDPLSACALAAWIDWTDKLWAARRLFPASVYFGDQGIDKFKLAMEMYENRAERRLREEIGNDKGQEAREKAVDMQVER